MNETAIDTMVVVFFVAMLAVITAIIVVGGVTLVWAMVTDLIDAIREREEKEDK